MKKGNILTILFLLSVSCSHAMQNNENTTNAGNIVLVSLLYNTVRSANTMGNGLVDWFHGKNVDIRNNGLANSLFGSGQFLAGLGAGQMACDAVGNSSYILTDTNRDSTTTCLITTLGCSLMLAGKLIEKK